MKRETKAEVIERETRAVARATDIFNQREGNESFLATERQEAANRLFALSTVNRYRHPSLELVARAEVESANVRDEAERMWEEKRLEGDRKRALQSAKDWVAVRIRLAENLIAELNAELKALDNSDVHPASRLSWCVNHVENFTRNIDARDAVTIAARLANPKEM